jgi:hypothetical protein
MPDRALLHIPLLNQIIPARFSSLTGLAAALLVGISADRWWRFGRERLARRRAAPPADRSPADRSPADRSPAGRGGVGWAGVVSLALVAALVPVASSYRFPFVVKGGDVPRWFTTAAPRLAAGTVVLTVPYPSSGLPQAMGWQAVGGLHFRLVSGYAIVPGRDGRHSAAASPLGGADAIFDRLSFGLAGPEPTGKPAELAEVRSTLRRWGVQVVVVTTVGRDPSYSAAYFTAVLGRPPRVEDGAWAWHGIDPGRPLTLAPGTLGTCAATGSGGVRGPEAAAGCVLSAAR